MTTYKAILGMLGTAAALSGCATVATLSDAKVDNKVYSGTIEHARIKCAHATCMDFPFSLVADTLLLPVTIPWTVVNLLDNR